MKRAKAAGLAAAVGGAVVGMFAVVGHGQDQAADQGPVGAPAVVVMNHPTATTRIDSMLTTRGVIIVRGYTDVGTVQSEDGAGVSVTAVELTDVGRGQKEYGLAVGVKQAGRLGISVLTYVDWDELESLASAMDYLGRMDSTVTQLTGYEGRFKSKADLEVANFADSGTRMIAIKGVQVLPETGQVVFATAYFPLSRLGDVKQLVASGRQILEKARAR